MKRVVAILALLFFAAEVNFPVEAAVKNRVLDLIKKRKNNSQSSSIENIADSMKGLGSSFASSGSSQFKYVSGKFLNTEDDLSFLIAYSGFARSCEMFFSLIEITLSKIRTEYAALLGAQNRLNNASSTRATKKAQQTVDQYKEKVRKCLELLNSDGFSALNANLQCNSIILLKIIQNEEESPEANKATIKNQIDAFIDKYSTAFESVDSELLDNIAKVQEEANSNIYIKPQIEAIINNVALVHNILKSLKKHVTGRTVSEQEINSHLSNTKYYTPTAEEIEGDGNEEEIEGDGNEEGDEEGGEEADEEFEEE